MRPYFLRSLLPLAILAVLFSVLFLIVPTSFATNEQVRGQLNDWGNDSVWSMNPSLGGTFVYVTDQITAGDNSNSAFKFFKDSEQWYGKDAPNEIAFASIFTGLSTGGGDERNLRFNHIQNSYYVFKWNGDDRGVVFQLSAAPVAVTGVSQSPTVPTNSQDVIVTATTSAAPPAEQALWLRYAINGNWGDAVEMSGTGTTYTATIPMQTVGTQISYYVFSSGDVGSIASGDADLMTINADTNNGSNYNYTVLSDAPATITDARAFWLDTTTVGWNGTPGDSYRLLYDPDGGLVPAVAQATTCILPLTDPCHINLTADGTIWGYVKNPNATGLIRLVNSLDDDLAKELLRGQVAVASYDGSGILQDITGVQHQSVLDHLYANNAIDATLGVTYTLGITPTVHLWAPTAKSVTLLRFEDSGTTISTTHPMTRDEASGIWSVTGHPDWDHDFYLFDVEVYVPEVDAVLNNLVTDPYAVSLSTDSERSQFVNLDDSDLKPDEWDDLEKPELENFTDIIIYEMHVRDFSINETVTVTEQHRGTYVAFTYDGNINPLSDGMAHLLALQDAGLTHVHLLPVFDIATVLEANVPRDVWPYPLDGNDDYFPRDSDQQQAIIGANRADDGFNWGYDPFHFGVPEGSYATDPDGVQRIIEFRQMVQVLNQNGLRVVMDVVYNHTSASGQFDQSVLDKIVPGYYYRYDNNGVLQQSSCCPDTATEYAMMEKLMLDTLERFAVDYKIDGFRFDLMNLHTRRNMQNVVDLIHGIDDKIYIYGEGWTFGSAMEKGLTNCTEGWCFADKYNMGGMGIGLFNDIIRDAAHGGYSQDSLGIRQQGFINGLSYDWNGYAYPNRYQSDLHNSMNILRSGLRASGTDWSGAGAPFAQSPQESMPYISKHDNETLFDQNVFKMPHGDGSGNPGWIGSDIPTTTMDERVRAQNMGLSIIALSQGVPFFHMASDIMRSKSLDRNSYDSGDWFNRVYWNRLSNNFGQGLPPAWDNSSRWSIMEPLLANEALDPTTVHMNATAAHFQDMLRIRQSSSLFRLQTMAEVNNQVVFFNGDNSEDALIVMGLLNNNTDGANAETILVFFNADKEAKEFTIGSAVGKQFVLHAVQQSGDDDIVKGSTFNISDGQFNIPARTTAVFTSTEPLVNPDPSSTIEWVGKMVWNNGAEDPEFFISGRGGVAYQVNQGAASHDLDVYVRVYEPGWTDQPGENEDINCYLHWGKYGEPFDDLAMTWHAQQGNDDEYRATIDQNTLNDLDPGTYGFTAYCQKTGETGKKWKEDSYNIDFAGDDDQGDGLITVIPQETLFPAPAGGVFVHLFEWPWVDIEKECTFLAERGFTAVQVSPPNEHVVPTANQLGQPGAQFPWWVRYQPVSHDVDLLESRSGTLAEFENMINTCNDLGVDIYVDAVINHMADIEVGDPPAGTAGTLYNSGSVYPSNRFYGSQYGPTDFNTNCIINNYSDRRQVQQCQLSGLPDLNTGSSTTQAKITAYLQDLLDMGVAGFRIDASKHMAAHELGAILESLELPDGGRPFIYHEVIDADPINERIRDWEYIPYGAVSEFEYSIVAMGQKFNNCADGHISQLVNIPDYDHMMDSQFAVVFTDNHDNQRGHGPGGACIVDHRNGRVHQLANIFMLAYPYGYPMLTSSYYWTTNPNSDVGDSLGPPSSDGSGNWGPGFGPDTRPVYGDGQSAGDMPANCSPNYPHDVLNSSNLGSWVCEHRNNGIANMVQFRQVTHGKDLTDWVAHGDNHISFGREDKGFVAINRTGSSATTTYATSLPDGDYCDVISGQRTADGSACTGATITVNGGEIVGYTLNSMTAFAIHAQSMVGTPELTASQDFDLAISGSDTVTATLLTHDGLPVVGQNVGFARVAGEGSVAEAPAVTNNNGEAVITYNAPNTVTVAIVEATYVPTAGSNLTGLTAVYVGYRSNVDQLIVERLPTGEASIDLSGTFTVTKQGSGTPLITLAIFNNNPQSNQPGGNEKSAFVDIYLPDDTDVNSLTVVLDCAAACDTLDKVWWGDPVSGDWWEVEDAGLSFANDQVTFTLTGSSSPSLADLIGTPFVVSAAQPTAVTLAAIGVGAETAVVPWLLLLITAVLLTIAIGSTRLRRIR